MSRFFAALMVAVVPSVAAADSEGITIVDARVINDLIQWTEEVKIPVVKSVQVVVVKDGNEVVETREVQVFETVSKTTAVELKKLKATDGAGKPITAEKLTELLKEPKPVVVGFVAEKRRALFRETTIFLEFPTTQKTIPVPAPKLLKLPEPLPEK